MSVHFMSSKDDWETPFDIFDPLDAEFLFTVDVCASYRNRKHYHYYNKKQDGLSQDWEGDSCWMNPPYGREIGKWMKKAYDESRKPGTTVVCLVPARTDTKWWHEYAMKGEIRFLRGRIKFVGGKSNAPFPSAIVIFSNKLTALAPSQKGQKTPQSPGG